MWISLSSSQLNSKPVGFQKPKRLPKMRWARENLLIVLDGLDEVPSAHLDHVLNTIRDFVDRYDGNRFITSCRVAASGYRGSTFQRFSNVTMADFDDEQIKQFIINWFGSEQDVERGTAQKCWDMLQKPENKASKELAHTPLLLTYLCLVYDLSQRFPNNRSSLYKKALRILMEEWAAEKRILRDDIYEGLSIEQEEILLSEIAYDGMKKDQLFFDKRWLSTYIREFLAGNLNAPKGLDSEKVLTAIEVQQGILVERLEDQYSFSHLTLQEYLTAQYLIDNDKWQNLIQQNILVNRWREIFLLLPGLMSGKTGADNFLLQMKEQADNYINTPRLRELIKWAEKAIDNTERIPKPPAKRAVAITLVRALNRARMYVLEQIETRSLDREQDLTRALDSYIEPILSYDLDINLNRKLDRLIDLDYQTILDREFLRDLDRNKQRALAFAYSHDHTHIFCDVNFDRLVQTFERLGDYDYSKTIRFSEKEKFISAIYYLWFSELKINTDTASLSSEESERLASYCYICEMIIRCKESATRVSPVVWESIESSILTVPE